MHTLKRITGNRTAGLAAAVMVSGGLAGAVLMTPGTALAATGQAATSQAVTTATSISGTQQWASPWDAATVKVSVSVTAASGSQAPAGDVVVTAGEHTCDATLVAGSGVTSTGSCQFRLLADGPYTLTASYQGSSTFAASVSSDYRVVVGQSHARVYTQLNCPRWVTAGKSGTCTLVVSNNGPGTASDVSAEIVLPSQLHARYCGWGWGWGCSLRGNTASWRLGTLYAWQTKSVTVSFTAQYAPRWNGQRPVQVTAGGVAQWGARNWWQPPQRSYAAARVTIYPQRHTSW